MKSLPKAEPVVARTGKERTNKYDIGVRGSQRAGSDHHDETYGQTGLKETYNYQHHSWQRGQGE